MIASLLTDLLPIMVYNLEGIGGVLEYRVGGLRDGGDRVEVRLDHPDADGGVFLPQCLPDGDALTEYLSAHRLTDSVLDDAGDETYQHQYDDHRGHALTLLRNKVDGIGDDEREEEDPYIEGGGGEGAYLGVQ